MFGYVRPNKGELLVREFTRFRAVYCGVCKEIGRSYGQIPRIALTYDVTMLGVLLVSLSDDPPDETSDRCMLNPFQKRPMLAGSPPMHRCAALSVLLAYAKFNDEIQDRNKIAGNAGKLLLKRAAQKASDEFPAEAAAVKKGLEEMRRTELDAMGLSESRKGEPFYKIAAAQFGEVLRGVFTESFRTYFSEEKYRDSLIEGLGSLGRLLGEWIFLLDALDDYEEDERKGNWNPFLSMSLEEAKAVAGRLLEDHEAEMDRIAALLPYRRDAGIVCNIFRQGLPFVRQKIFARQKLGKL